MVLTIIIAVAALLIGRLCGYFIFRYVLTGKYKETVDAAEKERYLVNKEIWKNRN